MAAKSLRMLKGKGGAVRRLASEGGTQGMLISGETLRLLTIEGGMSRLLAWFRPKEEEEDLAIGFGKQTCILGKKEGREPKVAGKVAGY